MMNSVLCLSVSFILFWEKHIYLCETRCIFCILLRQVKTNCTSLALFLAPVVDSSVVYFFDYIF